MKTIAINEAEERLMRFLFEPLAKYGDEIRFPDEASAARSILELLNTTPVIASGKDEEATAEQAFRAMVDLLRDELPPARMMELVEEIFGVSAPRAPAPVAQAAGWRCGECKAEGRSPPTPVFCPTCSSPEISNELQPQPGPFDFVEKLNAAGYTGMEDDPPTPATMRTLDFAERVAPPDGSEPRELELNDALCGAKLLRAVITRGEPLEVALAAAWKAWDQ